MPPVITTTLQLAYKQIQSLLAANDLDSTRVFLESKHPADIADMLELLDEEQRTVIFALLVPEVASEVLDELNTRATRSLVEAVPDETIADLLEIMPVDDAAGVLSDLQDERAQDILALMEPADAAEVKELLGHLENTAGRLMRTDFTRLHADWTVERTLDFLRSAEPETGILTYLYVVNDREQLVGVVPLRHLITARPDTPLADIMTGSVISVHVNTDQEEVARLVSQYDFFAIPVIDHSEKLVGIITHDDVVDILHMEFTEDIQRIGGSQPLEGEYLSTPVHTVVRKRIGWLMVLFLTEMLTGTVIRSFEGELQSTVALAFFIPLLIGTGGNSGSQTTSTVIRAIAIGEVRFADSRLLLWHELRTGLLLGVAMGVMGFARARMWKTTVPMALTVGMSLFAIVLWANVIGSLLPPLAAKLRIDPAVVSGPVMSTLVDATGLFIYFMLAHIIMNL